MTEVPELMPGLDVGQAMSELSPATSVGPFVPNDLTNNYIIYIIIYNPIYSHDIPLHPQYGGFIAPFSRFWLVKSVPNV